MMCYRCYGKHWVQCEGTMVPCPECSGMGGIHCCDGLTESPCSESSCEPTRSESQSESELISPSQ